MASLEYEWNDAAAAAFEDALDQAFPGESTHEHATYSISEQPACVVFIYDVFCHVPMREGEAYISFSMAVGSRSLMAEGFEPSPEFSDLEITQDTEEGERRWDLATGKWMLDEDA